VPGAQSWELGWETLHARHPRPSAAPHAVRTDGRAAASRAHLVVVAMGGNAAMTGDPDHAPLLHLADLYYHAAPRRCSAS
jgi:hypothetical protein